ncbi:MAG: plastocyanin/azurin family copper-binding protein [Cohaesibacter sp.]|nr:plastocyanin/azurin family copper-binding protein [Cohaesibacter sp.]
MTYEMILKFSAVSLAAFLGFVGVSSFAQAGEMRLESKRDPAKIAKICAKAEARYEKLYGKSPSDENVHVVMMYKYTFCPEVIDVKLGETVRWVNVDKRTSHSTWFKEAGREEDARLFPDEVLEMTFDFATGEFPYLCGPHWESDDMIGRVIVSK